MSTAPVTLTGVWGVAQSIILIIVVSCVVGISLLVLLVCFSTKRRLMAVRNDYVPVLNQSISARQKKVISEEHALEASFEMKPFHGGESLLHGWVFFSPLSSSSALHGSSLSALGLHASSSNPLSSSPTGDLFAQQLDKLLSQLRSIVPSPDAVMEQRALPFRTSTHENEHHLATLVARSQQILEARVAQSLPGLVRSMDYRASENFPSFAPRSDVVSLVRVLQSRMNRDKRLVDRRHLTNLYMRARWSGPLRSNMARPDMIQYNMLLQDFLRLIDEAEPFMFE